MGGVYARCRGYNNIRQQVFDVVVSCQLPQRHVSRAWMFDIIGAAYSRMKLNHTLTSNARTERYCINMGKLCMLKNST